MNTLKNKKPLIGLEKYPEFRNAVTTIVMQTTNKIWDMSQKIESEMPYKFQFLLEEVIRELEARV